MGGTADGRSDAERCVGGFAGFELGDVTLFAADGEATSAGRDSFVWVSSGCAASLVAVPGKMPAAGFALSVRPRRALFSFP